MNAFSLKIISPVREFYNGKAVYCRVTTPQGRLGLEARHESLVATLAPGSAIEYRDQEQQPGSLKIARGLLAFGNNTCLITVDPAT